MTKDEIKSMLFGRQTQSESINTAVVNYVYNFMQKCDIENFDDLILYLEQTSPENINLHKILLGDTNIKLLKDGGQIIFKKNKTTGKAVFTVVSSETVKAVHKFREEHKGHAEIVNTLDSIEDIIKVLQPLVPTTIQKELHMNAAAQCLFAAPVYFGGMTHE